MLTLTTLLDNISIKGVFRVSTGTRITMTIPADKYELLQLVAESEYKRPGEVAKDIVLETLEQVQDLLKMSDKVTDKEKFMKMMYKTALIKIADTINP